MLSIKEQIKNIGRLLYYGPKIETKANISYLAPSKQLTGKKIIITGGGKGIGKAMATKFVSEGAEVLIAGRNEQNLKIEAEKLNCHYLLLDVQNVDCFEAFINKADKILNGANCLVNNAGISLHEQNFTDVTPQTFDSQFNTNLRGCFFLTQKFYKLLSENKREGNILFLSSETGNTVDFRPYGLTKAAINSFVKGLASLTVNQGIRVNGLAPGITASDMTGVKADGNLYYPGNIINRIYLPEEIAQCACFLLSDASGCISGEILTCNNGKTINSRWKSFK